MASETNLIELLKRASGYLAAEIPSLREHNTDAADRALARSEAAKRYVDVVLTTLVSLAEEGRALPYPVDSEGRPVPPPEDPLWAVFDRGVMDNLIRIEKFLPADMRSQGIQELSALWMELGTQDLRDIEERTRGALIQGEYLDSVVAISDAEAVSAADMDSAMADLQAEVDNNASAGTAENGGKDLPASNGIALARSRVLAPIKGMARWAGRQGREIRSELDRAFRPPVKVSMIDGHTLGIEKGARYGGGFVAVPLPSASSVDVISVQVEERGATHSVVVLREATRGGRTLSDRVWSFDRLEERSTAEHIMGSIVKTYTRGKRPASRRAWLGAAAAAGLVVFVVTALPSNNAKARAEAPSEPSAVGAMAGLSPTFDANGGLPPELMAQILAGAGSAAPALDQHIKQASAQAFADGMHAGGPPQIPAEASGDASFGLGKTIAGCDPELAFKVRE
ncbi:hypothetical protein ACW0US_17760 [Xanthomonas euvesicatoria]